MSESRLVAPYGYGIVVRRPNDPDARALLHVPVAPFRFAGLAELAARVEEAVQHAASVRGLKATTCAWARDAYRGFQRFLTEQGGEARFVSGDLREQTALLEQWIGAMRLRGLSYVGINAAWRGLTACFRWIAAADGVANPMLFVPTPRVGRILPRVLRREEAGVLVRFVRNFPWGTPLAQTRNLAIIGLMLLAGLRRGEVVRLEFGDVDPVVGTARIRGGKGEHGGKDRMAYLPLQLREIVAAYIVERGRAGRTHAELITHLAADRGINARAVNRLCAKIGRLSGLANVRPHALRHSFATHLRQANVPDRVAMELMGHTSLTMLQRYSHVFSEEPLQAVERLSLDGL